MPLVSVIIPTTGTRPTLLKRAIVSALQGMPSEEIEIVLIPNGSTEKWSGVVKTWERHENVRIHPISSANASTARNEGLRKATGDWVRFLDDDDFLIPEIAVSQYDELRRTGADISSYAIRIEDERGADLGLLKQADTIDFVEGCLSPARMQLPHAHVYARHLISGLLWPENIRWSEDIVWLHTVCQKREVNWIRGTEAVGVWYQHRGPRVSLVYGAHAPHAAIADSTLKTIDTLRTAERLTRPRLLAAIEAMWTCVHRGFYLNPFYWHEIGRLTQKLDPSIRPQMKPYTLPGLRRFNPLTIEWTLFPKRYLNHLARSVKGHIVGWDHVRRL